jgi:DNA-binding transcriptional ArsR family regulator
MAEDVFSALANPTRRALLGLLLDRPRPVQELAAHFDMRRPSVSEHIKVLRDAGLVTERRQGRQRIYELDPAPLGELRDWLHPYQRFWRAKLREFGGLLDEREERDDGR